MRHVRLTTYAVAAMAAGWLAMTQVSARQEAPGAPGTLNYLVNNANVAVQWTHASGPFTHYQIEAGPGPGAPPFFVFPTSAFANPGDPFSKLPQMLSSFAAGPIGGGTYYVKVRGMNGAVSGPPSNEIALPVTGACQPPGAPRNFTTIVRGTSGFLQWHPGDGGQPTAYGLVANFEPNRPDLMQILMLLGTPYFTLNIPPGNFYVRILAGNACGISPPSEEILVTSPGNTPNPTPNPPAGQRLPQPYVRDLVFQFAQEAINAGYLNPSVACPARSGSFPAQYQLEARKTQRNPYIDHIVTRLRQVDQRFGFNAKPTRSVVPAIIAGDEIAYHYGSDAPEGSPNVYLVDVLGGHCTGVGVVGGVDSGPNRHTPDYRVFYDEFGRWTLAGLAP